MPAIRLDHDPSKCLEVLVAAKQTHAADRAVEHVIDVASRCFGAVLGMGVEHTIPLSACQTSRVPVSVPRPSFGSPPSFGSRPSFGSASQFRFAGV